jgi:hypothetical protein
MHESKCKSNGMVPGKGLLRGKFPGWSGNKGVLSERHPLRFLMSDAMVDDEIEAMTAQDWMAFLRKERKRIARRRDSAEIGLWTQLPRKGQAIVDKSAVLLAMLERLGRQTH